MAAENFKVKKGLEVGTGSTITSGGINITGVVTATTFVGDGSGLTGVTGSGSGVVIKHDGSAVGTASTINFSTNLDVSAISAGVVTVTASNSGLSNVVEDTTPQLGGNLDLDGKFINGTGGANITGVVTATTFVGNGDFVNLDVDGETDLDNVSISGVTTITNSGGLADFKAIELEKSGTTGASRINFLENGTIRGGLTYSHDNNRIEIISENGESIRFQDKANNQFGSINSSGLTLNGDLDVDGQTDLDDVAVSGVSTFTGAIDANGNLDVDGQTDLDDVVIAGVSTFNDGITLGTNSTTFAAKFADDAVANFGTGNDLQISHASDISLIRDTRAGAGATLAIGADKLFLRNKDGNENYLEATDNGSVKLFFDFAPKFETASHGVVVTGVATATTFSGSGASLTNLPSAQLTGALPALDGSALTGVTASGSGVVVKHDGSTVGTAGTINFSTNLDVTAVSAGIVTITASGGSGITTENVVTDSLVVSGISTFDGALDANSTSNFGGNVTLPDDIELKFGSNDLQIYHQSGSPGLNHIQSNISSLGLNITTNGGNITLQHGTSSKEFIVCDGVTDKNVEIYCNGTKRIETTQSGSIVSGIATATTFSGSGASLTSLNADELDSGTIPNGRFPATLPAASGANLTSLTAGNISGTIASGQIADEAVTFAKMQHVGTGVFIGRNDSGSGDIETLTAAEARTLLNVADGATVGITTAQSNVQVTYTVTANGSSAYRFDGNGVVNTADNPDLYLIRGQKYRFINNSGGSHPFQIREVSGGSAYSTGVKNNGASSGNIEFAPTYNSPAKLVYQCTSHGGMVGNIYIRGGSGGNMNVGVTTFSGDVYIGNDIYLTDTSGGYEQVEVSVNDIRVEHKHIHSEFGVWARSTSVTDRRNGIEGDSDDLLLYSNTTEKVRISSNGNVGVNTDFTGSQTWRNGRRLEIFGGEGNVTGEIHLGAIRSDANQSVGSVNFFDNGQDTNHKQIALIEADKAGSTSNKRGGDLIFFTKNDNVASPTEKLRIDYNGMIGIGEVPKTQNTFNAIEIGKTGFLGSQTGARTIEIASNAYYNSGWKYKENDVASLYYQYQGYHAFASAGTGSADGAITFDEHLRIAADGKVGINTASPNTSLSVYGSVNVTKGLYGRHYSGATTIDTGFMVGELSNYSHAVFEVIVSGNPNHFGSGYYRASSTYMVHISTGWTGSALSTRIRSTRISYGDGGSSNNSEVTATFHLYDATTDTETNSGAARDNNDQLRIKIAGTSTASGIQCFVKLLSNPNYLQ